MSELKDLTDMVGKKAAIATSKPDGTPFWQSGIFQGESPDAYFFTVDGKITVYPKSKVMRIEFDTRPSEANKA